MSSTAIDRVAGLSSSAAYKGPCLAATTANITLSGLQTIDGVTLVADDRVLVRSQSDSSENGIYIASAGDWELARDFSRSNDVLNGSQVLVTGGSTLSNHIYRVVSADDEIEIGVSDITFTLLYVAGSGAGDMLGANNLSDVTDAATARTNIGAAALASPALTGTPTVPTLGVADDSTKIANSAFVQAVLAAYAAVVTAALALKATLASPAFTGTPTAPTASAGDNSTKLATTAYADAAVAAGLVTTKVKKSATQNVTDSTTLTSDSELTFAMAANKNYHIKFRIAFRVQGAAGTDFKYSVTGPASPTIVIGESRTKVGASSTLVTTQLTDYPGSTTLDGGVGYGKVDIDLFVANGANAGTCVFKFACGTDTGGTDVASVLKASTLEYDEV